MTGPCKCVHCAAPDDVEHYFDCGYIFGLHEDQREDKSGNPQCVKCWEKKIEQADALRKAMKEEEALDREIRGRIQDRKEADRINGRW